MGHSEHETQDLPDEPDDRLEERRSEDGREETLRKCDTERETMTPRETADCAGESLADLYDREEDGGS